MQLVLLRHGEALAGGPFADADRPLTSGGAETLERVGRGLARVGVAPAWVLASPALRCRQSAEILAAALGVPAAHQRVAAELAVGEPVERLWDPLAAHADAAALLVVGHEPQLAAAARVLLGGRAAVRFEPGGGACFAWRASARRDGAALEWWMTPSQLAGLAAPPHG
jgi:phosphohistidine phosphatase